MNLLATLTLAAAVAQAPAGGFASLKGQIVLPEAPPAEAVNVTVDKGHCLSKGPLMSNKLVVDPATKGLKNVIVWLRPDTDERRDRFPQAAIKPELKSLPPTTHVVDQPCCEFVPRVLAVRVGDTVEFRNGAPVAHNIHYIGQQEFNTTLAPGGKKVTDSIEASNGINSFKCDIHPWMAGAMRVFDNPYYAVTDAQGKFEIKDAPVGKWRLVIWHEAGFHKGRNGILGTPVEVKAGGTEVEPVKFVMP